MNATNYCIVEALAHAHLLIQVLLQKREQQEESLVCCHHAVALLQALARGHTVVEYVWNG